MSIDLSIFYDFNKINEIEKNKPNININNIIIQSEDIQFNITNLTKEERFFISKNEKKLYNLLYSRHRNLKKS